MATRRAEKHYSRKYTDSKGPDVGSSLTSLESGAMTKAMSSMKHVYFQCKATAHTANEPDNTKKLKEGLQLYLDKSPSKKRLPDFIRNLIEITLESYGDDVDLKGMMLAFQILEDYALKLAWYPWKKQIRKIKVHAAYVKMYVEPYVKGTKEIFKRLGYQKSRTTNDELIIEKMPERDVILEVAFDCYIAQQETEIYVMVYDRIKNDGFSVQDVHKSRLECSGTDKDAVTWIWDNCKPTKKRRFPSHSVGSSVSNSCRTEEEPTFYSSVLPQTTADIRPRLLDTAQAARLKMYEEEASKAPAVPPRGSSTVKTTADVLKDVQIPYIDSQKSNNFDEGTLEEHVSESLKLVEKSNSFASSEIRRPPAGDEWKEVYKIVETLGEKYSDPGGRGDILKGEEMVPKDDEEEDFPVKAEEVSKRRGTAFRPSTSSHLNSKGQGHSLYNPTKYAGQPIQSTTSGYNSKHETPTFSSLVNTDSDLYASSKTSGYTSRGERTAIPRVDLMKSDLYSSSSSARPSLVQPTCRASTNQEHLESVQSYNRNISVDGPESLKISPDRYDHSIHIGTKSLNESKHEFSTFRGSDLATKLQALSRQPYDRSARQTDDPDYVQLKQVNPKGKPSFEKNFQATTQRLYQASSNTSLSRQPSSDSGVRSSTTVTPKDEKKAEAQSQARWQCESCTYLNEPNVTSCVMCSKSRLKGAESDPLSIGGSQCRHCTYVNAIGAKKCEACEHPLKNAPTFV